VSDFTNSLLLDGIHHKHIQVFFLSFFFYRVKRSYITGINQQVGSCNSVEIMK